MIYKIHLSYLIIRMIKLFSLFLATFLRFSILSFLQQLVQDDRCLMVILDQGSVHNLDNDILCLLCCFCSIEALPISKDLSYIMVTFISIWKEQIWSFYGKSSKFIVSSINIRPTSFSKNIWAPLFIKIKCKFRWPHSILTWSLEITELSTTLVDPSSSCSLDFPTYFDRYIKYVALLR